MSVISASEAPVPPAKPSLVGETRAGLADRLRALDIPEREIRMRVNQLWNWTYFHGVRDFDAMLIRRAAPTRASAASGPGQVISSEDDRPGSVNDP